jgi:hypothetical protein
LFIPCRGRTVEVKQARHCRSDRRLQLAEWIIRTSRSVGCQDWGYGWDRANLVPRIVGTRIVGIGIVGTRIFRRYNP